MKKIRKFLGSLLCLAVCCCMVSSSFLQAEAATFTVDFDLESEGIVLVNLDTGTTVFEKNADERLEPASITKIMTYVVVCDHVEDLENTKTTVSSNINQELTGTGSSMSGVIEGEELSILELLNLMMVPSGNDAALVLAEYVGGGDWHKFVDMMNEKAKELGCENTSYMDPTGISSSNKITARDMVKIAEYAMTFDAFREAVSHESGTIPPSNVRDEGYDYYTTNYVMFPDDRYESPYSQYMTGVKTGWIPASGYNFTGCLEKDGYQFISVVMGGEELPYDEERIIQGDFVDTISLYKLTDDFEPPADYTWIYIAAAAVIAGIAVYVAAVKIKGKKKKTEEKETR